MPMPALPRMTIAAKLLAWTSVLIVVFCAVSAYLFQEVRASADTINHIVEVNHEVDSSIQRMLERLYAVQDNIRRFKRLGKEEAVNFIVEDLDRFGEILEETLKRHPKYRTEWQELTSEFEIVLTPADDTRNEIEPDSTIINWVDILEQSLIDNQTDTELSLTRLRASTERTVDMGMYGLMACLFIGFGGSLALAWSLNRSLVEVRQGIRQLGTGSPPRDVRVLSGDELGELAEAFNRMADRLRREEAMRADFIAMLSHEIRTPLTSIREAVDLVGTGAFGEINEKQRRFLSIAEEETIRLSGLLERLMTVSRLESQSLELTIGEADGGELVRSAVERLEPTARARRTTMVTEVPDTPLPCLCDHDHIRQVLLNIAGNAIKFTPKDGTVTVTAQRTDTGVKFIVRDTGPGIPEEEQPHVFNKYFRAPGVLETVDGAGLGLAIARRIVEAHGATLELQSKPGQGASFSFTLPDSPPEE